MSESDDVSLRSSSLREEAPGGLIAAVVRQFLTSKLSILLILFALSMGVAAILVTPREEEPQIVVPLADIYVQAPGASAEEVEKLAATPLERLLWQIDGVEYVYSVSRRDMAVVTVRFHVGEDRERSLVKLHNKITMHIDQVPLVVQGWVIKPVEIDDVPIVTLTLYSDRHDDHQLRRIGEELLSRLSEVEDISRSAIVGGRSREIRVELIPEQMAGLAVSPLEVERALRGTDASVTAGSFSQLNREFSVTSDAFLTTSGAVGELVVGVREGRPVYLRDVASISDGPEESASYTRLGFSERQRLAGGLGNAPASFPAVTLALAKKKGTNAVVVAETILRRLALLEEQLMPAGVRVEVTRNYGATAQAKVDDLLSSLAFAILTVVGLLALTLGWRESLVVALAVPISFSLALFVNYLLGYTINRVTLFALILSLGLVVDDPITNVDNIQRHILAGKRRPLLATLFGVSEVLPPVIMSTLAIIVSFTPLFFITGMMGPYMAPMAGNVPLTVSFSTVCALTIVPWLAHHLLKRQTGRVRPGEVKGDPTPPLVRRLYRAAVGPLLRSGWRRTALLAGVLVLLGLSLALPALRQVPLKMLPFDNKNELQLLVDMPEGTTLENTDRVVRALEAYLREVPEVTLFVSYVGLASPMDFNGLVRHYYLRRGGQVADIRVNLVDRRRREQQSHEIGLRLRRDLERIGAAEGAQVKIVEVPPGPPVLATVVAEVYGPPDKPYSALLEAAAQVRERMQAEPFVTEVDDTAEAERPRWDFALDREKAALHGVSAGMVTRTLRLALSGETAATVHAPGERQALPVRLILPRAKRSGIAALYQIPLKTASEDMILLGELGTFVQVPEDQPIYHKNLERVVFVFGEMAGRSPAEAVVDLMAGLRRAPLPGGFRVDWAGEGEWQITLRVFRDLGLAFGAALMGIYILLVIQMNSFSMPLLIMVAIPLTLIGIMPGFWLFNLLFSHPVGPFPNPVFFTATSMIGMIALGGIVIRNSLVLIEFIQDALRQGSPLQEAVLESGAIRLRPIVLTAATTALGAWPITLDPIFSGLAWALIFGLFASTLFTLLVVPVAFFALNRKQYEGAVS